MVLTGEMNVPVGQWQQWGMQRVMTVAKDRVPLVDLLNDLQVQTVLLQREEELGFSAVLII